MSIPRNHHYVSQCHIRLFFNEQDRKIYCYDKERNNYFSKTTSKTLFSEQDSNSRVEEDTIDHETLEKDLKTFFEDDFERHARNVIELAEHPSSKDYTIEESLYYLACHALIADIRVPENKRQADDAVDRLTLETAQKVRWMGDEMQAKAMEAAVAESKRTKYSNLITYSETAGRRLERMGDLDFNIIRITSNDVFLLPDVGCIQMRDKINHYINPYIREIAIVGIPLTSKIFLFACSKKLADTQSGIRTIDQDNSEIVQGINAQLYESAVKVVAGSDESKLKSTLARLREQGM